MSIPRSRYKMEIHDSTGDLVAIMQNTFDATVEEQYSQLSMLKFSIAGNDSKISHCAYENEIWLYIDGAFYDCYRMDHFTDGRRSAGIILTVEAVQAGDRLNEDIIQDYSNTTTIQSHMTALLALQKPGAQITFGGIDAALNLTREFAADGVTIWKALQELRKTVGGILQVVCGDADPLTRELWLKESIGEDKGQQVRYRKNLTGITRDIDYRTGVYANKLYPYGSSIQLDTSPLTDTPTKGADATYGYLALPQYSCYKNWTGAGNACPSGMVLIDGVTTENKVPTGISVSGWGGSGLDAFDDDLGSSIYSTPSLASMVWTGYAQFNISGGDYADAVLVYASMSPSGNNPQVEIGVYDDSSWETIFTGTINHSQWVTKVFAAKNITAFRMRFRAGFSSNYFYIHEVAYRSLNIIADWEQGSEENVIRVLLADYNSGYNYELVYTHTPYLRNVDATGEISKKNTYNVSDIVTLRGLSLTDFSELAQPYTTYQISVADLSQDIAFEFLRLGSNIAVIDEDMDLVIQTRIVKLTRQLDKNNVEIDISNLVKDFVDTVVNLL